MSTKKGKWGWTLFGMIAVFGNFAIAINFGGSTVGNVALVFGALIWFVWAYLTPYALKEGDKHVH